MEVAFELSGPQAEDRSAAAWDAVAAALRTLPGVHHVHIDHHGTWAMVGLDPEVTTMSAVARFMETHGVAVVGMRTLLGPGDESEASAR